MKEVFLVSFENKAKAEELLKKDDLVSRGSITIRSSGSLDIKEDGYFILIDASKEALEKADELLKGIAAKYKDAKKVIEKFDEEEERTMSGFGTLGL